MTIFSCFRTKAAHNPDGPAQQTCSSTRQQPCAPAQKCADDSSNYSLTPIQIRSEAAAGARGAVDGSGDDGRPWVNDPLIKLTCLLPTLDGGWWSALSEASQAMCEHLGADHTCIYVLSGADFWATSVACAGVGATAAAGRAFSSDPRFNGSAASVILRSQDLGSPSRRLVFRSAQDTPSSGSGDTSTRDDHRCVSADELPGDWQLLHEEHGCRHFAAVALVDSNCDVSGVLSLATKGPSRPMSWTPEALHSLIGLLAPHIRRGQAVMASPALSQLHAAATFSDLVQAAAEAAVDATAAVAYARGQSRVAFIQPEIGAAAIFQLQEGDRPASVPQLLRARRSSCEFVTLPAASVRKSTTNMTVTNSTFTRTSMDANSGCGEQTFTRTGDGFKRESWMPQTVPSFTLPFGKGCQCKGHTLTLDKTLLGEALAKQVAGLCIDDCQAYTVNNKAYPRDLVLTRGAMMPLSLALATISAEGKPLVALYLTYPNTLPRPMLQAVVQELQQLLQAMLPVIRMKLSGPLLAEYEVLGTQLEDAAMRKHNASKGRQGQGQGRGASGDELSDRSGTAPDGDSFPTVPEQDGGRMLSFVLGMAPSLANGGGGAGGGVTLGAEGSHRSPGSPLLPRSTSTPPQPPAAAGGAAATLGDPAPDGIVFSCAPGTPLATPTPPLSGSNHGTVRRGVSFSLPPQQHAPSNAQQPPQLDLSPPGRPQMQADGSPFAAAAAGARSGLEAPEDLVDRAGRQRHHYQQQQQQQEGDMDVTLLAQGSCLGGLGSSGEEGGLDVVRARSACENVVEPNRRLLARLNVRSVSFRLEAAQAPRGASKLAPIIASMHERLMAAQAVQMTTGRSEARKADLQSVKLLQEIGQGGYGTVYRGTYHGAEVAIKVIMQSQLAGMHSTSNAMAASSHGLGLHKQHLHDAIELVASVSMSHTNIVQVPAFFIDVRLEKPEDFNPLDSVDHPTESKPFRLIHSPSLIESPAPGQEGHGFGEGAMALVLEYCDCGSLCDAIMNRKFIEKVTPKRAPANGPAKTYLAINMRSVYQTLLEIALALRHMHSLALVHCDLKPQNVLLKSSPRDPRGFTAKLSDFGLTKMMAHNDDGQLVIDDAVASGTITHVAPEVLLGQKALGAAVDIYAFGILMFQVLCGMKVYDKNMSASAIANAVAHRFMRPQLPSWVPASYRALAQACWQQVPSARPTADELVRHLERAIEAKRGGSSGRTQAQQPQL